MKRCSGLKYKLKSSYVIVSLCLLLGASSCQPDEALSIQGLQLPSQGVLVDTLELQLRTVLNSDVTTENYPRYLVGFHKNNLFGSTYAGLAFSLMFETKPDLQRLSIADSAILELRVGPSLAGEASYIGDLSEMQTWNLYMLDTLLANKVYPSDTSLPIGAEVVGTYRGNFPPSSGSISFKMSQEWVKRFDTIADVYTNETTFSEFFKGLYLAPDTLAASLVEGAVLPLTFNATVGGSNQKVSYMRFYQGGEEIFRLNNPSSPGAAALGVNIYRHNYPAGGAIENALLAPNTQYAFLQGAGGLATIAVLQNDFRQLASSTLLALHQAEVVFPADPSPDGYNTRPQFAILLPIDSLGKVLPRIPDFSRFYYGGEYDEAAGGFVFNLTNYFSEAAVGFYNGDTDNQLLRLKLLLPSDAPLSPSGVRLKNGISTTGGARVVLTYSKAATK